MKVIPTRFKNVTYRSRTEARWAVFFDNLGVVAEYEPEGYVLAVVGRYLPDFLVHSWGLYVEVKGIAPTDGERAKAQALALETGKPVLIVAGAPGIEARGWLFDNNILGAGAHFAQCRCGRMVLTIAWHEKGQEPSWTIKELGQSCDRVGCGDRWTPPLANLGHAVKAAQDERFGVYPDGKVA